MSGSSIARRSEDTDDALTRRMSRVSVVVDDSCVSEPEWCVEQGPSLAAMTTSALVAAVSTGEIDANTRVWREGLECWTRILDVPELSLAFGSLDPESPTGTAATPLAIEIASPSAPDTLPSAPWPASWGPVAPVPRGIAVSHEAPRAHHPSSADLGTRPTVPAPAPRFEPKSRVLWMPAPEPTSAPTAWDLREAGARGAPPRRSRGAAGSRFSLTRADAFWIGGGFAVAVAAIGVALARAALPAAHVDHAVERVARIEQRPLAAQEALRAAVAGLESERESTERRATVSRTEPGQRRLRGRLGPAIQR